MYSSKIAERTCDYDNMHCFSAEYSSRACWCWRFIKNDKGIDHFIILLYIIFIFTISLILWPCTMNICVAINGPEVGLLLSSGCCGEGRIYLKQFSIHTNYPDSSTVCYDWAFHRGTIFYSTVYYLILFSISRKIRG